MVNDVTMVLDYSWCLDSLTLGVGVGMSIGDICYQVQEVE